MNVRFNQRVKHGRVEFVPSAVVYAFEDPDAAPYFIATGWAEETTDPADVTYTADEINIDPETVWGTGPNRGEKVIQ